MPTVYAGMVSDETAPQAPPAPIPEERTVGDVVAGAVEAMAKPIARLLGRRGPCPDCERRKKAIKHTVDRMGRIRIGKRPR